MSSNQVINALKQGSRRIRSGVVGQATQHGGKPVFFVEEWRGKCPCPDCEADGHWVRIGENLGYANRMHAEIVANPLQVTVSSGMDDILGRIEKLEA